MALAVGLSSLLSVAIATGQEPVIQRASRDEFSSKRVTVEFKQIRMTDFFQAIAQIENTEIVVDACAADQTLSLKMQNAPVRLIVEAVCEQLNLSYERRQGVLHIGCR